jgi:hypothetical protein
METRIRVRLGDLEIECTGDETFVATRLPELISDLVGRLRGQQPAPATPPGGPPSSLPPAVSISGRVINYFGGNPVGAARVSAIGLTRPLSGTSDASGLYGISGDSAGGECFLSVTGIENFVDTTTGPFNVAPAPLTLTAFAVTAADLNRQYAIVGRSRSNSLGVVIVHLLDASRQPLEMATTADVTLTAGDGSPVGAGPFFFASTGDIDAQLTAGQAFAGRVRAAFLDVPAGNCTLRVLAPAGGLQQATVAVPANTGAVIVEAALGPS